MTMRASEQGAVRNDPPATDDFGLVVRPVGPIAVTGGLTDAELRATPVAVSGTFTSTGLTDAELRASPVPVSGTFTSTGLTDAELRATPVPFSAAALPLPIGAATEVTLASVDALLALIKAKTDNIDVALSTRAVTGLTNAELRAVPVPVSGIVATGGLTDAELRAVPVPISGTVATGGLTDAQIRATPLPVSGAVSTGGLTDAELRASAVPISAAALPLPVGAATDAGLAAIFTRQADGSQHAVVDNFPATQAISAVALPLPTGAATQVTLASIDAVLALIKAKTDNLDVALSTRAVTGLTDTQLRAVAVPISGTVAITAVTLPLPTDAATQTTLALIKAKTDNLDVALSTRAVTGLTDAQLRAVAVPVSGTVAITAAALPLPADAATQTTLALIKAKTDNLDVAISTRTKPADQQHAIIDSSALPTDAATQTTLALIKAKTDNLDVALSTRAVTGLTNTELRAAPVPVSGTVAITAAALPLPADAATQTTLALVKAKTDNLDVALSTVATQATLALIKAKTDNLPAVGQATMAASTPVAIASDQTSIPVASTTVLLTGTLANGVQVAVGAAAVQIIAANAARKTLIVQNVGAQSIRVGIAGVGATTGAQLVAGASMIFESPYIHTGAVYAIRESADSTALVQEIT